MLLFTQIAYEFWNYWNSSVQVMSFLKLHNYVNVMLNFLQQHSQGSLNRCKTPIYVIEMELNLFPNYETKY